MDEEISEEEVEKARALLRTIRDPDASHAERRSATYGLAKLGKPGGDALAEVARDTAISVLLRQHADWAGQENHQARLKRMTRGMR